MSAVLYQSGFTQDGVPLLAGLFRMKDEAGFPLDMAYELCKERGMCPDWAEYLADAGSQQDWKWDAAADEMRLLIGPLADDVIERFKMRGACLTQPENSFTDVCRRMLSIKRGAT